LLNPCKTAPTATISCAFSEKGRNKNTRNLNRDLPVVPTACLLAFALALRLHHLDYESLWIDELLQVSFYAHPFDQIARYAAHQQQPPLDYWIGFGVSTISNSDFAVRLPSVFFGVGVVYFLTLLVARLCTLPIAYGVGIVAALFPFNIYFSQEARPYSIAIFLFLALLWAVARLLNASKGTREKSLTLFLISVAFVHSRGLEPLIIVALLIFILTVSLGYSILSHRIFREGAQRVTLYADAALGLSLVLYLPTFKTLLDFGEAYLTEKSGLLTLGRFFTGIEDFSFWPIVMSFVFQTEPVTYPLLALLLLSPFLARRRKVWPDRELVVLCSVLLPGISLLHLFVFQSYTHAHFKPQYAFYLLPLTLILSGIAFQVLWDEAGTLRNSKTPRALLAVFAAFIFVSTVNSTWAFKTFKKKEDWKGLCHYLAKTYGPGQMLLFDTLVPYGEWEGSFYGFRRYYDGSSKRLVVSRIPSLCGEMVKMDKQPVLILHHRAEWCLTPQSLYCRCLPPTSMPEYFSLRPRVPDPRLSITAFTGFQIVTLKEKGPHTAGDAYTLISESLSRLPANSSLIDLHLASAGLARVLGLPQWEKHLASPQALSTEGQRLKMSGAIRVIEDMPPMKETPDSEAQ
jgi:4-amino-4-deoxy-L-arabinose transferase-like glycosyltransferase